MMPHPPTPATLLQEQKQRLRDEMRARRQADRGDSRAAAAQLAELFLKNIALAPHNIIASIHPFRGEIDPGPLTDRLRAQGHAIALPLIIGKQQPLHFHLYKPGDVLRPHPMGMLQPDPTAPLAEPDIILVPLLAFDRARRRIGYGGGYYDRTIAALRQRKTIQAIGIAYEYQKVETVPVGPHDVTLDRIITELNLF